MPALTGSLLTSSSAYTNQLLVTEIARNIIATSTVLTATSANVLNGYLSNFLASSAVISTSATALFNAVNAYVRYGSSAQSFVPQLLGASSCIDTMVLQNKAGLKISS